MRCDELRRQGLVIGSDCFEAMNRMHIFERLQGSRVRRGINGARAVLTFRSLVTIGGIDCAWDWIMQARGSNGVANDNQIQIRQPLAA